MEAGPGVIDHSFHQSVFDRIPVNVVEASLEIVFIANRVFPKSLLPNGSLSVFPARCRVRCFTASSYRKRPREAFFDQPPSQGVILDSIGQRPDCVQVIGQQHECLDRHGMLGEYRLECGPQANSIRAFGK